MTHSLLCYVIRALNNDQPNGKREVWMDGSQRLKPVRRQLRCANTSMKPFPLLVFAYKESRSKVAFDCYVCLSKKTRNQPACCAASLNQLFWVRSSLSFSHSRRICSDTTGEALGAAAAAAAVVVRPVCPVLPLQRPCCLQAPDGMSAQRSPNEIRE